MSERPGPRISVNKLGEYMIASPARRRRIVADQKRPREFIVTRYRDAVGAMLEFLAAGARDDRVITRAIANLEARAVSTDFQSQDRDLCIEALESFLDTVDQLDLRGVTVRPGDSDAPPLLIGGVSVSVRPEIVVTGQNRNGGTVGCVKLYLSKSFPLNGVAGAYIGAVLTRFAEEYLAGGATGDYRLCVVVDVFGQHVFTAPRAVQRRQADIEAACEEIALLWNVV
ncbi:MAG: hypothetical protein CHACPFDD_00400 [Phycisphaerae bacterium]|nr:hypothetical protein [Phycisphaerae bacterium]